MADLVRQTSSWWRKDWEEVESEISRMTNEFKEHLARKQEKHERVREKKMERRERKNKRIKRNLDYLKEKYGISSSDSSDSDDNQIQGASSSIVMTEISRQELEKKEEEKEEEKICWLCQRSFQSGKLLLVHREKSQLHKDNLAKQEEQNNASAAAAEAAPSGSGGSKGGFKNTFSTVT